MNENKKHGKPQLITIDGHMAQGPWGTAHGLPFWLGPGMTRPDGPRARVGPAQWEGCA